MAFKNVFSRLVGAKARSKPTDRGRSDQGPTALYTYLNATLKSPRFRRMLEEAAKEHAPEVEIARRA